MHYMVFSKCESDIVFNRLQYMFILLSMCALLWKCTTSNLYFMSYRDVLEFFRSECVHGLRDGEVHDDDWCDRRNRCDRRDR